MAVAPKEIAEVATALDEAGWVDDGHAVIEWLVSVYVTDRNAWPLRRRLRLAWRAVTRR